MNTRGHRTLWVLPDETVKVPLLLCGWGINAKNKIVSQQVRSIDIIPTIAELISMPLELEKIEGRSLVPLIEGKNLDDVPIFIENAVRRNPTRPGNTIGVRTLDYKYYRSRKDPKKKVHLYALKKDPNEIHNIAKERPNIVKKMEEMVTKVRNNSIPKDVDPEETKRIEDMLKPFGSPG